MPRGSSLLYGILPRMFPGPWPIAGACEYRPVLGSGEKLLPEERLLRMCRKQPSDCAASGVSRGVQGGHAALNIGLCLS